MLASIDRRRGVLDDENVEQINEVVRSLLAEFADHGEPSSVEARASENSGQSQRERTRAASAQSCPDDRPVLCVGGPGPFDHTAALIVAQLLENAGIRVRLDTDDGISPLNVTQLATAWRSSCLPFVSLLGARSSTRTLLNPPCAPPNSVGYDRCLPVWLRRTQCAEA